MMTIKIPLKIKRALHIVEPLAHHHYFIVTILLFCGVGFGIFTVNQTLNTPTDAEYKSQELQTTIGSKFNKTTRDTIDKIKKLQKSTDAANPDAPFPAGRINPFAE